MSNTVQITYTDAFAQQLGRLITSLSDHNSETQAVERLGQFIDRFEASVNDTSQMVSASQSLVELGVASFYEFSFDSFLVVFSLAPEQTRGVTVYVIAQRKQSFERLLIQHCLQC